MPAVQKTVFCLVMGTECWLSKRHSHIVKHISSLHYMDLCWYTASRDLQSTVIRLWKQWMVGFRHQRVDSSSESPRHQRASVYAPTAQTPLETITEMQRMSKCSWDAAELNKARIPRDIPQWDCSRLFQDDEWKSNSTPRRKMPSRTDQFDLYIHMYIYNQIQYYIYIYILIYTSADPGRRQGGARQGREVLKNNNNNNNNKKKNKKNKNKNKNFLEFQETR